jgi:ribosomal protein S1
MSDAQWNDLPMSIAVGEHRQARVARVDRWGLLLDLGLPFPGFMDRLHIGDDIDVFQVDDELEVEVVQLAEYNRQVRVAPVIDD